MAGRRRAAFGAAVVVVLAGAAPVAARAPSVPVRGMVTDESGVPVPGLTVRVLKSRSVVELGGLKSRDQTVEELRTTTDAHGFFEIQLAADSRFPHYYLRFYDPQTFDAVKYAVPEDRDISRRVRKGRPVQAPAVLKFHPDWPRVRALLEDYPPGTQAGQVLRSLGLPSRRTPQDGGREIWIFDKAGVEYLVEGSRVLETRSVPRASAAEGPAPAEDRDETPTPAVRIEDR
jgi:hypothetical protein